MPQIPDPTTELKICPHCGLAYSARLGRTVPAGPSGAMVWMDHFCADAWRDQRAR